MRIKLSFAVVIILLAVCLYSQNKAPLEESGNPISAEVHRVDRKEVIEYAKSLLGSKYLYAGVDPVKGFDCSGFVYYVFRNFNINLPHGSREYKSLGTALKPEDFKVGDVLVFYGYKDNTQIGHVGIICEANGMKSRFIHSSSGKAYGVTISELDSQEYTRRFYKCIDVIQ